MQEIFKVLGYQKIMRHSWVKRFDEFLLWVYCTEKDNGHIHIQFDLITNDDTDIGYGQVLTMPKHNLDNILKTLETNAFHAIQMMGK